MLVCKKAAVHKLDMIWCPVIELQQAEIYIAFKLPEDLSVKWVITYSSIGWQHQAIAWNNAELSLTKSYKMSNQYTFSRAFFQLIMTID